MAVKMRLMRVGKKKSAAYRVVIMDERSPRDGRYIDLIGRYDPRQDPSVIDIDEQKAIDWLRKGVQPTESVRKILEISGAMSKFKVASGKIHTVPSAPQPVASEGEDVAGDDDAAGTADDTPVPEADPPEAGTVDVSAEEEPEEAAEDDQATPDASEEE